VAVEKTIDIQVTLSMNSYQMLSDAGQKEKQYGRSAKEVLIVFWEQHGQLLNINDRISFLDDVDGLQVFCLIRERTFLIGVGGVPDMVLFNLEGAVLPEDELPDL
jgi:hypothetical protein|tara:strand:- start:1431 stop:1745 length:315 start_codon:yes stop_codon:yes gene_type:complete